jgi:hypothetical protein
MVGHAIPARGKTGINDRTVSGASAEVPCQRINRIIVGRRGARLVQRKERHHHSRRAEAALTSVVVNECLLDRMQRSGGIAEILHRDHLLAMEHGKENEARIHCAVFKPVCAIRFGEHDRAGTTIAFGTTLFDAPMPRKGPQILKKRRRQWEGPTRWEFQADELSVEDEENGGLHWCGNFQNNVQQSSGTINKQGHLYEAPVMTR